MYLALGSGAHPSRVLSTAATRRGGQVTAAPLSTGRWYLDDGTRRNATHPPRSWVPPTTPLYHTKGRCGAKDTPVVDIPETARYVEVHSN